MSGNALITGLSGFTGQYMAAELTERGYDIFGLGIQDEGTSSKNVDLRDAAAVRQAVAKIRPDIVVHLAGVAFVAHGDAGDIYSSNIVGTRNLLAALAEENCLTGSILLASSANVYGNQAVSPLAENTPVSPQNDYAVSKCAMELMAQHWVDRLQIVIARPFNYTGVGQSRSFLLPKIVDHYVRQESRIELGNIDVFRDFSDVRMVADAYARLLEQGVPGTAYNVCSGVPHSIQEVLAMMSEIAGYDIEVTINPAFVRANEVKRLLGDNRRLAECIGELRHVPLTETLAWMFGRQSDS